MHRKQEKQKVLDENNHGNITSKTINGFFWMFSGNGVQGVSQLIVLMILARLIGPTDFGIVQAALVIVSFSMIFSQMGVGPAIVQRPFLSKRHIRVGFILSLLLGLFLALFIFLSSPLIAKVFRIDDLDKIIKILSIIFILQGLYLISESLLQRELKFKVIANIHMLSYVLGYGVISITLALLGFGVWSLIIGQIALEVIKCILFLFYRPYEKGLQIDLLTVKELMYFGGGFTLARLFNFIALQGDKFVVGRWLGPEALGLYGRAYQLMVMPAVLFGQVLDKVLFPAMAKIQSNQEKLAITFRRGMMIVGLVILPVSIFSFLMSREIIIVLLGSEWLDINLTFKVFAIALFFRTSYKISESLTRATGAVYRRAWRQGIYALLVLTGTGIGQHWGLIGVSIGILCALLINFILMTDLSLNIISKSWGWLFKELLGCAKLPFIVFIMVALISNFFREVLSSSIIILILSFLVFILISFILIYISPKWFLGNDGVWILRKTLRILKFNLP